MGKENTGGGYSRGPSALAVGPGAHNMFGQEEARVCWKRRVRGKGTWRGKKGPFSLFFYRRWTRCRNSKDEPYEKCPTTWFPRPFRSLREEQNWLSFQVSLDKSARESLGWRSGSFLLALSSPSVWSSLSFEVKPSRFLAILAVLPTRRIFPDAGVQFLRKRELLSVPFVSEGVIDSSMLER